MARLLAAEDPADWPTLGHLLGRPALRRRGGRRAAAPPGGRDRAPPPAAGTVAGAGRLRRALPAGPGRRRPGRRLRPAGPGRRPARRSRPWPPPSAPGSGTCWSTTTRRPRRRWPPSSTGSRRATSSWPATPTARCGGFPGADRRHLGRFPADVDVELAQPGRSGGRRRPCWSPPGTRRSSRRRWPASCWPPTPPAWPGPTWPCSSAGPATGPGPSPGPWPATASPPGRRRWRSPATTRWWAASSTCSGGSTATPPPSTGCWCRPSSDLDAVEARRIRREARRRRHPARGPSPRSPAWSPCATDLRRPGRHRHPRRPGLPGLAARPSATWSTPTPATERRRRRPRRPGRLPRRPPAATPSAIPTDRLADVLAVLDDGGRRRPTPGGSTPPPAPAADAVTVTSIAGRRRPGVAHGRRRRLRRGRAAAASAAGRRLFDAGRRPSPADAAGAGSRWPRSGGCSRLACSRATARLVATAAPEPGVLLSRFVEGWPPADVRSPAAAGAGARLPPAHRRTPSPIVPDGRPAPCPPPSSTPTTTARCATPTVRACGCATRPACGPTSARSSTRCWPRSSTRHGRRAPAPARRCWPSPTSCGATTSPATGPRSRRPGATSSPCSTPGGRSRAQGRPGARRPRRRAPLRHRGRAATGSSGRIDRDRPGATDGAGHPHRRLQDGQDASPAPTRCADDLQLAVYHLAATRDPELAALGPATAAAPALPAHHARLRAGGHRRPRRGHRGARPRRRRRASGPRSSSRRSTPTAGCCSFHRLCPLQPEGREVGRVAVTQPTSSRRPSSGRPSRPRSTPQLLVAGAGTGKTTVMAQRILHLVESGAGPAPTRSSASRSPTRRPPTSRQKVRERARPRRRRHRRHLPLLRRRRWWPTTPSSSTSHPGTQVLNRAQAWQLLFAVFDEFRFERRSTLSPQFVLDDALALASRCADHLVPIEAVIEADCRRVIASTAGGRRCATRPPCRLELCQVVAAYERRKRERNLLDFGDQIGLAVRLLAEHPERGRRAARSSTRSCSSTSTRTPTSPSAGCSSSSTRPGSAVTAVGDDMQSIYGFRGAHLANILHFSDHFPPVTRSAAADHVPLRRRAWCTLANRIQAQVGERAAEGRSAAPDDAPDTTIECFLAADDAEEAATIAADIARPRGGAVGRHRRAVPQAPADPAHRRRPRGAAACRSRWSAPAACSTGPRWSTWSPGCEVLADPAAAGRPPAHPRRAPATASASATWPPWPATPARLGPTEPATGAVAGRRPRRRSTRCADLSPDGPRPPAPRSRPSARALAGRGPPPARARPGRDHRRAHRPVGGRRRHAAARTCCASSTWPSASRPVEGDPGLRRLRRVPPAARRVRGGPGRGPPGRRRRGAGHDHPPGQGPRVRHRVRARAGRGPGLVADLPRRPAGRERPQQLRPPCPGGCGRTTRAFPPVATARMADIDDVIRRRKLDEEWRLLYVACTRAQRRLVCSAAHWYPGPAEPQGPSEFYDFVAAQTDLVTERFRHEPATVDPDVAAKERRRAAAARRYADPVASELAGQLRLDSALADPDRRGRGRRPPPGPHRPCRSPAWSPTPAARSSSTGRVVRPLPRRSSAAARLGTEVHRWIEQRAGRQLSLIEPDARRPRRRLDPDRLPARRRRGRRPARRRSSPAPGPTSTRCGSRRRSSWSSAATSCGAASTPSTSATAASSWSTSRPAARPPRATAARRPQLDLYGLAAVDTWGADPDRLRTTYCYLRTDGPPIVESTDWDARRWPSGAGPAGRHPRRPGRRPLRARPPGAGAAAATSWPSARRARQSRTLRSRE